MSDIAIVLLFCGSFLTVVSIFLFCESYNISGSVRDNYGSTKYPNYLNLQDQKKAIRILRKSFALLFFGALAFIAHFIVIGSR